MLKNKKNINNKFIGIFLAIITILQIGILMYSKNEIAIETMNIIEEDNEYKTIRDIYSCIDNDKNISIISLIKEEKHWNVNITLSGDKDEILKKLNLLRNFIITDYEISYENKEVLLNLHLKSK